MKINLVIMQSGSDVHAQCFLDPARYIRYQLMRRGHDVKVQKNRLCHNSVNVVFGAHNGFLPELAHDFSLVFVNLEQLTDGGARLSAEYIDLLSSSLVLDYDVRNIALYRRGLFAETSDVAAIEFGFAPYLQTCNSAPLEERPIDLLFFGSINEKRRGLIDRIERCGVRIHLVSQPLYGAERDELILASKAVLNIPFYDSGIFEQCRVFPCLSLGTPVISLHNGEAPEKYIETVSWFTEQNLQEFFCTRFATPSWYSEARARLRSWRAESSVTAYSQAEALLQRAHDVVKSRHPEPPVWRPRAINLGSGKDYRLGWLNIDVEARTLPDLVLDLSTDIQLPIVASARDGRRIQIDPESVEVIYADNVLEHVRDLPAFMGNVLNALREGGVLVAEVPHERSKGAWQDPTHVRAFNERSWLYYTDWCWYLGWNEWRFDIESMQLFDENRTICKSGEAAFMRVSLVKRALTPFERTRHRTFSPTFADLPDDRLVECKNIILGQHHA